MESTLLSASRFIPAQSLAGGLGYTNNPLPVAPVGLLGLLLLFQ